MLKFGDFHMIDPGGYWAFVAPFDELFDSPAVSLGDNFNAAVRKVRGAAFDVEVLGFVLREEAKINALNSTGNQDFNFTHHS
jgi:hypothetical protein